MTIKELLPILALIATWFFFTPIVTRPFHPVTKKYLLIAITGIYAVSLFFFSGVLALTGFFIMLLALIGMNQWPLSKIALILSPILTYPLLIIVIARGMRYGFFIFPIGWEYSLMIYILLFSIVYAFLLKNFWHWLYPQVKKTMIAALIVISMISFAYSFVAKDCHRVNYSEKGVSVTEVERCRFFHLYDPGYANHWSGVSIALIDVSTQGPIFISTFLVLNFLIFRKKSTLTP